MPRQQCSRKLLLYTRDSLLLPHPPLAAVPAPQVLLSIVIKAAHAAHVQLEHVRQRELHPARPGQGGARWARAGCSGRA